MPQLERQPGRKVTRRLEEPRITVANRFIPTPLAGTMADAHNAAVREYGSDSGGCCAFDPVAKTWTVWASNGSYPRDTVVTRLSWGRIDAKLAQCLLEGDGYDGS